MVSGDGSAEEACEVDILCASRSSRIVSPAGIVVRRASRIDTRMSTAWHVETRSSSILARYRRVTIGRKTT